MTIVSLSLSLQIRILVSFYKVSISRFVLFCSCIVFCFVFVFALFFNCFLVSFSLLVYSYAHNNYY